MYTAKGHALLKSLTEFRPYLNNLLFLFVQSLPPLLHGFLYHFLYVISIDSIENIAKPTLVNMDPILLFGEVLEESRITFSMVQEILLGETLNNWHS